MAEEIGANWDTTKPKDVGRKYVTAIKDAFRNLGIVSDIVQAGQFMDREFSDEIDTMQMYLNMLLQSTSGGNEPMMDNIKTQFTETLYEAEEEETDMEVDAEEETDMEVDAEEKTANDSIVVDKRIVSLSSLPGDTRKILDSLETLRAQAEEFGDQKFITQVGNTITFFTRDFVVAGDEPTKAKVDESDDMEEGKKSNKQKLIDAGYSESDAEDFVDEFEQGGVKVPQKVKDILSDKLSMNESMFPMWNKIK